MPTYIALLRKDEDSDYGVDFPDFPGCVTAAESLAEARSLAKEALQFHVEGLLDDNELLPEPDSLDRIMAQPENSDAVPFPVTIAVQPTQPVRVQVTFAESVLKRIDAGASSRGISRSDFLAQAAVRALESES